jgi:hypothetical protein
MHPLPSHKAKAFCFHCFAVPTACDFPLRNFAYELKITALVGNHIREQKETMTRMATAGLQTVKYNARIVGHMPSQIFAGLENCLDNR